MDSSGTHWYYYNDKWQVTAAYDGFGSLVSTFVYGNYVDEVLLMKTGQSTYYYAHDQLYSPVALVNSSGAVSERYEYDAYGAARVYDATYGTRSVPLAGIGNPYLFTGREVDYLDNGSRPLQYNRHRYYLQGLGRWTSEDPLGIDPAGRLGGNSSRSRKQYADGLGLYGYTKSKPMTYLDPLGLFCDDECTPGSMGFETVDVKIVPSTFGPEWKEAVHAVIRGAETFELIEFLTEGNPTVIYSGTVWAGYVGNYDALEGREKGWNLFIKVKYQSCQAKSCCPFTSWQRWAWTDGAEQWIACKPRQPKNGPLVPEWAYGTVASAVDDVQSCADDFSDWYDRPNKRPRTGFWRQ